MDKRIKKHITVTNICLLVFIVCFFYAALYFSDGEVDHTTPGPFFLARDTMYSSQLITDIIDNNGFERAAYVSDGKKSYYYRPPVFGGGIAILSDFTGMNEYDLGFFFCLLAFVIMTFSMYLMISNYSKVLALFSLPLAMMFFTRPFHMALTWGRWPSTINILLIFMAVMVYVYRRFDSPILLGAILGFGFMTHFKESVYFSAILIPLWLVYEYVSKRLDFKMIKNVIGAYIIAGVMLLGFIPYILFLLSTGDGGGAFISYDPISSTRIDIPVLGHFGLFGWLLVAGIILWLLHVSSKKNENLDKPVLFALGYLIFTYIGLLMPIFRKGITQNRFFWPITLCVLSGFGFYFLHTLLHKKLKLKKSSTIIPIFILILVLVFSGSELIKVPKYSYTHELTWQSLMWMKDNTPENASFVSIYGHNLRDDAIHWPSKRNFQVVEVDEYTTAAAEGIVKFDFKPHNLEEYAIRTGLFSFELYDPHKKFDRLSLCQFDYLYFNKMTAFPIVTEYTAVLTDALLDKRNMSVVYDNGLAVIMHNPNPTEECLDPFELNENEEEKA